jgi:hypothetical protein
MQTICIYESLSLALLRLRFPDSDDDPAETPRRPAPRRRRLPRRAADTELNLYSARHYQTDEALYSNFTAKTGIKINRIEGKEDELLERIRNEGANSPADVFITVDAARLAVADAAGVFAPVKSETLKAAIPDHLHTERWFSFSTRARVIVYNKLSVTPDQVRNYEDLANPALKGKVCTRSGSHPYNLSLGAALIQHIGAAKTEDPRPGGQLRPRAQGRRHRPDQGRRRRRMRRGAGEHLLPGAHVQVRQARRPQGRRAHRRGVAQPGELRHPHQRVGRRHAEIRAPQGGRGEVPRIPGLARPRTTSPTATTNGRWWPA